VKAARRGTYIHCECGLLVRLAAVVPESPEGKALADARAVAYVGECPSCKALAQTTFASPSVVITNPLSIVKD
jgi:hypothetical protein